MSNNKKTSSKRAVTVVFGARHDELPGVPARVGSSKPSDHWQAIADGVKAVPGVWHEITLKGLGMETHRSAVARIKNATTGKPVPSTQSLASFTEPGFDAAWRDGVLLIRYDAPTAAKVRKIGMSA